MNKRLIILLLFQTMIHAAFAQPGGGGGIRILNILDYSGKHILKGDTNLQIQLFALSNNEKKQKFQIPPGLESKYEYYDKAHTFFYLPPFIRNKKKNNYIPNQRLILIYSGDTMTIDFIDVLRDHGAGNSDVVTNIYFKSGYYKSYRNPWNKIKGFWGKKELKEILNAMSNGINTNTDYILVAWGLLKHIPDSGFENKRLERNRKLCVEEIAISPYYRLCEKQITIQDSTINLQIESNLIRSKDSIILHYLYYFSFNYMNTNDNSEVQLAATKLLSFEKFNLKVNNENFTGILKLAVPFHNAGISSRYSGYNLWIIEYSDGKLIHLNVKNDVDIISEQVLERPN